MIHWWTCMSSKIHQGVLQHLQLPYLLKASQAASELNWCYSQSTVLPLFLRTCDWIVTDYFPSEEGLINACSTACVYRWNASLGLNSEVSLSLCLLLLSSRRISRSVIPFTLLQVHLWPFVNFSGFKCFLFSCSPIKIVNFESHYSKLQADSNYLMSEEYEVSNQ